MPPKSGWKTTEFWLTLTTVGLSVAKSIGLLPIADASPIEEATAQVVSGIFGAVTVIGYAIARAKVKK